MQVSFSSFPSISKKIEAKRQARLNSKDADVIELSNKKEQKVQKEPFYKRFQTAIVALLSSFATGMAVLVYAVKKHDKLIFENQDLKHKNNELQETCCDLQNQNGVLTSNNSKLNKEIAQLKGEIAKVALPENFDDEVAAKLCQLKEAKLSYIPTQSPVAGKKTSLNSSGPVLVMPSTYEKTTNRSDAKKLDYPVFVEGMPYNFEFPTSSEIQISHETVDVKPIPRTATTISESYADSLAWDNNKIARDLLQNFYDGHGQTLDGVKFNVTPKANGKYTVRIEGKSTYSPDKAILLGETSKKNNDKAAGNYGEGLKMVVLKLLREKGAENVDIASGNWNVNWQMQDCGLGKKVLAYQLDKIPTFDGNYIEFDTNNKDFIKSIINTFDRFYHYNNPAFSCPDYENEHFGIKFTEKGEKGRFFIAGQAFEVDASYEGLTGMNIFIKKKPPVKHMGSYIFDPSRDRTSLNKENLSALGSWLVSRENMTNEELVKLLATIKDYWDIGGSPFSGLKYKNVKGTDFLEGIIKGAGYRYEMNVKFPSDKDVAAAWGVSDELQEQYVNAGYRICNPAFDHIGMRSIKELVSESRKHTPLEPTEIEKNKILILKDAINLLAPVFESSSLFEQTELDTKIYIFDRNSKDEDASYKDTNAEAIIEYNRSRGFWIDRGYMQESDFSTVLGTALHELTHKYGGDETMKFSYKLTDVMRKVFLAINENPGLAVKLKVLEEAWKEQK